MSKTLISVLALCWLVGTQAAAIVSNQTQTQNDLETTTTTTKPVPKVSSSQDNATEQSAPFVVSVQIKHNVGYEHLCGGTIIAERFILTAAHCFIKYPAKYHLRRLSITAGSDQLHNETAALRVPIKRVAIHQRFVPLRGSDIALVQLAKALPLLGDAARFRSLNYNETKKPDGLDSVLVGWGRVKIGQPKLLESLHFQTMHNAKCRSMGFIYETKTEICAMNLRGRGACDGDSGGPLLSTDLSKLYGILSYGKRACQQGKPYAFTRISPFVKWIKATMARLSK